MFVYFLAQQQQQPFTCRRQHGETNKFNIQYEIGHSNKDCAFVVPSSRGSKSQAKLVGLGGHINFNCEMCAERR